MKVTARERFYDTLSPRFVAASVGSNPAHGVDANRRSAKAENLRFSEGRGIRLAT